MAKESSSQCLHFVPPPPSFSNRNVLSRPSAWSDVLEQLSRGRAEACLRMGQTGLARFLLSLTDGFQFPKEAYRRLRARSSAVYCISNHARARDARETIAAWTQDKECGRGAGDAPGHGVRAGDSAITIHLHSR